MELPLAFRGLGRGVSPVPLADCRLCRPAPELELQVFGAGRRGVPVEPLVGRDGPTVAPIEPLVGQAAPKGVAAV
jgi:hypothetical protein